MKRRGKAKARARRQAREKRLTGAELADLLKDYAYTEKAWEPLPEDTDDETKRFWALVKPAGAPPVPGYPDPPNRPAGFHLPFPAEEAQP